MIVSEGYERRLRAKRVMVTSEASNGRVQWHSYGGRFWSVLPHCSLRHPCDLTHFVIPVSSLLWRKILECSSSLLTSLSLCPHSLRHPCVLTPMTCLLTHLIVIPDFSLESSHPSHPWLLTLTSLVLPLIPYSVFSHTPTLIALTKSSHRHPWLLTPITCATMLTHPRVLSHLTSLSAHTHHLSSHTHHLTSSVTTRTLTSFSLVSPHWVISHHLCSERVSVPTSMVSYYHQVYTLTALRELVLPLTLPWCRTTTKSTHSLSHCLLSHTHSHGVVLPPSHHTPTPILVLPLTPMSSHTLLPSLHFTSFSPPTHPNSSPTLSHPSCLHRIIITSYHQSLPTTTNRFLSLHTTLLTPPFHSQPSQSSPKSSPISIHTHNDNSRTP